MPLDPLPDRVLARRLVIGGHIRRARRRANLTQMKLGELVGVEHRTVHRWEYATADPSLSDLLLIADACGVPVAELLAE